MELRARTPEDLPLVEALLGDTGLTTFGLDRSEGWVLAEPGRVVGHIALERAPGVALLRSLAVSPDRHGQGLGRQLLDWAEAQAGPDLLVLRSDAIGAWVLRRGYRTAALGELPAAALGTSQFSSAGCCKCMPTYIKETP